jgi:hypothetical protein
MTTLQTGGFGPAPEIGAPLAPFRFVDQVKPLSRFSHMQIIIDTRDLVIRIRISTRYQVLQAVLIFYPDLLFVNHYTSEWSRLAGKAARLARSQISCSSSSSFRGFRGLGLDSRKITISTALEYCPYSRELVGVFEILL